MTEIRHKRKSEAQLNILMHHFKKSPTWDYTTKLNIADSLGMTLSQV